MSSIAERVRNGAGVSTAVVVLLTESGIASAAATSRLTVSTVSAERHTEAGIFFAG
jgi:hypothetical protein